MGGSTVGANYSPYVNTGPAPGSWTSSINGPGLGAGVAAIGAIAQFVQADQQARAEDRYNGQASALGSLVATQNAQADWAALSRRRAQEAGTASEAVQEFSAGAIAAESSARVAGLEAGASGSTLGAIVSSYTASRLRGVMNSRANQRMLDEQFVADAHGIQSRLRGALFELMPRPVTKPNPFNYLAAGAIAASDAASKFPKAKNTQ